MSHHLYRIAILLITLPLLVQCDNDKGFDEAAYPRIITLPVTNIGPAGAAFHATTVQAGTDAVVNRGFVWGLDAGVTAENGERIDVGPGSGDFDATVSFGLVKDQTYYVKAFAATAKIVAYGPVVAFVSDGSLPPEIVSFSPASASYRDTVTITGSGFSYISGNNVVKFGDISAPVYKATESWIKCTVPTGIAVGAVRITVKVGTAVAQAEGYFTLISPTVDNVSPAEGTFGSTITITGTHFGTSIYDNVVRFDTYIADLVSVSANKLVVKVPSGLRKRENVVTVTLGGLTITASKPFNILAPVITNLSVVKGKTGDLLTINGNNFNGETGATTVMIGGNPAIVQAATSGSVTVTIPGGTYPDRSVFPEVTVAEQNAISPQAFELQDPWFRRADNPGSAYGRNMSVAFAVNGSAYIGLGVSENEQFWRYIPATDTWSEVAPFPGGGRVGAVSFAIGNFGYVGLGGNGETDFWRFDPSVNTWTRIADFPYASSISAGFAVNGKGYVVTSAETENFWEYNPANNSWTTKKDYPFSSSAYLGTGFVLGTDLYVYSTDVGASVNEVYRYNAASNGWVKVASPDYYSTSYGQTGYSVAGSGYIRDQHRLLKYSPASNTWQVDNEPVVQGYRRYSLAVQIGGKVYFGCGEYLSDWWEYDPMLE